MDAWASSYFRLPNYGADWDMQGTCSPPDSDRSDPHQLTVANGTSRSLDADPFTVRLYRLDSKADLVHVTVDKGSLRINGSGVDDPHVSDGYYCTDADKCMCPPTQHYAGPNYTGLPPSPEPYVALTGGPSGLKADVDGVKKICKPGKPPPAPPGTPSPNPSDNTLTYSGTLDGSGPNGDATVTVHVAWTEHATSPGNDPSTVTWQLDSLTGTFSQSGGTGAPPCSATLSIKPGYAAAFGPGISHLPGQSTYDLKVHSPADGEAGSFSPASFQIQKQRLEHKRELRRSAADAAAGGELPALGRRRRRRAGCPDPDCNSPRRHQRHIVQLPVLAVGCRRADPHFEHRLDRHVQERGMNCVSVTSRRRPPGAESAVSARGLPRRSVVFGASFDVRVTVGEDGTLNLQLL